MKLFEHYKKERLFKKYDVLLYAFLILTIIIALIALPRADGAYVEIFQDGKLIGRYDLASEQVIEIKSDGYNKVIINNGSVYVSESDCANQICVNHRPITKANERIICAPYKVVVIIRGDSDIDAYTGGER